MTRTPQLRARISGYIRHDLTDGATGDPLALGLLDSLAIAQLVAFLEEEFRISLRDEDLVAEHFESLDSVTALVETRLRAAS